MMSTTSATKHTCNNCGTTLFPPKMLRDNFGNKFCGMCFKWVYGQDTRSEVVTWPAVVTLPAEKAQDTAGKAYLYCERR